MTNLARQFMLAVGRHIPQTLMGSLVATDAAIEAISKDAVVLQLWTIENGEDGHPLAVMYVTASGRELENTDEMDALAKRRVDAAQRTLRLAQMQPATAKKLGYGRIYA